MSMTMPLPRSARSSASSTTPTTHLLTPVYELDNIADSAIASSSGSSSSGPEDPDGDGGSDDHGDDTPRAEVDGTMGKGLDNATNSLRGRLYSGPSIVPLESPPLASSSFSFGSCPSVPLSATPTSELGPFDYPVPPGSSAGPSTGPGPSTYAHGNPFGSPRRQSLALGMTHRRGSIVAGSRSPVEPPTSTFASTSTTMSGLPGSLPSPPATRRSSTCSTITTLPAAGHRPAILHSASTTSGAPPPAHAPPYPHLHSHSHFSHSQSQSPPASRRTSLLFPPRPSVAPIPPSLLARRGSLPAAQLFGVPSSEMPAGSLSRISSGIGIGGQRERASFAGHGTPAGYTTSTPALYARRASLLSDDGTTASGSSTSASTITTTMDDVARWRARSRRSSALATTSPSAPTSPRQRTGTIAERRLRRDSVGSRPSATRPGGEDEDDSRVLEESDEAEGGRDGQADSEEGAALPTPVTTSSLDFTDPWATAPIKQALDDVQP